jgi:hypothetical protein
VTRVQLPTHHHYSATGSTDWPRRPTARKAGWTGPSPTHISSTTTEMTTPGCSTLTTLPEVVGATTFVFRLVCVRPQPSETVVRSGPRSRPLFTTRDIGWLGLGGSRTAQGWESVNLVSVAWSPPCVAAVVRVGRSGVAGSPLVRDPNAALCRSRAADQALRTHAVAAVAGPPAACTTPSIPARPDPSTHHHRPSRRQYHMLDAFERRVVPPTG